MFNNLKLRYIGLTVLLCSVFVIQNSVGALAACSNPSGSAGDQMYNSTHNVMQFCDGTHWTAMKKSTETDPQVNTLTGDNICKANSAGTLINCTLAMPTCNSATKVLQWNGSNFTCANI